MDMIGDVLKIRRMSIKKNKNIFTTIYKKNLKMYELKKVKFIIKLNEDNLQEKAFLCEFPGVSSGLRNQLLRLNKKRAKNRMQINLNNN